MIEMAKGDLLQAPVEALVNAVNVVGVMGKGIALQFKTTYPDMFQSYKEACQSGNLNIGKLHIYEIEGNDHPGFIINFPTKRHWRNSSKIEYVDMGLVALVAEVKSRSIHSIAIPALGCGLGGLAWDDVYLRIVRSFDELPDVKVLLFPPHQG
jgi:O-acetyl-ADP-ribose deacetylase (regulator of RNase III)